MAFDGLAGGSTGPLVSPATRSSREEGGIRTTTDGEDHLVIAVTFIAARSQTSVVAFGEIPLGPTESSRLAA